MDFKSALTRICNDFNKEIIFEGKIISILDDYSAFRETPYYKLFYKTVLLSSNITKLIDKNENIRNKEIFTFVSQTGLDEIKVSAFINILFEIYHGIKPQLDNAEKFNRSASKQHEAKRQLNNSIQESLNLQPSKDITFLGIPLGSGYFAFENALYKRDATLYNRTSKYVTFWIKRFLLDKDVHITLMFMGDPKIVYQITIDLITGVTVDEFRENFTNKLVCVYKSKYGAFENPNEGVYFWALGDTIIQIRDNLQKTTIDYKLRPSVILKYENYFKARKIQEAERLRKEKEAKKKEEEAKKKKAEDEAKLREAKRLFDTI